LNETNFPALSALARQYLGVPATSALAERLFSIAGLIFDDLRQAMTGEMLEMIMLVHIAGETTWYAVLYNQLTVHLGT